MAAAVWRRLRRERGFGGEDEPGGRHCGDGGALARTGTEEYCHARVAVFLVGGGAGRERG